MDDARVGRLCRALRRRRGWRQSDLAAKAGCQQTMISRLERGHVAEMPLATARAVFAALDAAFDGIVSWRAGDLDRLLDERHAATIEAVATFLRRHGWTVIPEASYSEWGERGSIDILAAHPGSRTAAVFEIKTEIASVEETIRKHDQKARLAGAAIANHRFGWSPECLARILVVPEDSANRRVVRNHEATFSAAYPLRSRAVRRWLQEPVRDAAGLWFLSPKPRGAGNQKRGGPRRVRSPRRPRS